MTSKKKHLILDLRHYAIIVAKQNNGRAFSKKIKIEIVNYCLFTLVLTFLSQTPINTICQLRSWWGFCMTNGATITSSQYIFILYRQEVKQHFI